MADVTDRYRSPSYGGRLGHAIFHLCIRWFGVTPAYLLLMLVVPYYVSFRPGVRRAMAPYIRRRYPGITLLSRFIKTVRHAYAFGQVLIDRAAMGMLGTKTFSVDFPGAQELRDVACMRRGLVLLTTHVGNWQASMAYVGSLPVPVHFQLQMDREQPGRHFLDLAGQAERFRIVSPRGFLGGLVELTNALNAGECVAVMGDRAWGGKTRRVRFLGEEAAFPITPYRLALATGAALVVLLAVRTGRCAYRIERTWISRGSSTEGRSRDAAIGDMLQQYVGCLEEYVRKYPRMWFNHYDLWGDAPPHVAADRSRGENRR